MKRNKKPTHSLLCLCALIAVGRAWSQAPPVPSSPIPTNTATEVSVHALLSWNTTPLPAGTSTVAICYSVGGSDETWIGPNRLRANVVTVPTVQTLAEMNMELSFVGPLDLHYYVFEATSESGSYTPVFHKVVSHTGTGRSLYSSGPMQVVLSPGRYYAIGAAWGNTMVSYYRQRTSLPTAWALGTIHGYLSADTAPPFVGPVSGFYSIGVYSMKLCFPSHDVYLGTAPDALNLVASNLTATAYAPGPLAFDTTYYWQVTASNASGLSTGPVWQFTTALDVVHFAAATQSVDEDAGSAVITVERENPAAGAMSVQYGATNGTATDGADFTAVSGTLEFPAGVLSTSFLVPILDDSQSEGIETVLLWLREPSANVALSAPSTAVLSIVDEDGPPDFQIAALSANNSRVVDHDALTGDDRGGIAVSTSQVFVTGDSSTARYNAADLSGGVSLGSPLDSLCTDLRTESIYALGNGSTPLTQSGGTVTTLIHLDALTGQPTGVVLPLSSSFTMTPGSGAGIFSGYGRIVVHNGARVYDIFVPSGRVTDRGAMTPPSWFPSENWSIWGVAESFGEALYLTYRDSVGDRIVRSRVPDGTVTEVASFSDLSDMASFVVSPSRKRWYFHYEGSGQFGGSSETLGYADAFLLIESTNPPVIVTQPADRTVGVSNTATFCVGAFGSSPLSYVWQRDGVAIVGATQACYSLPDCQLTDSGSQFSCLISNAYGTALSSVATLTVVELGPFFDDFDPDIEIVQWSGFGGVVGSTVLANNYGGFVSSPNSLWFGDSGSRYAVSRPLNTMLGGELSFWLRISDGSLDTWESADLPGEGIVLEYSIDDGNSWVELGRYDTDTYTAWTQITEDIPLAAQTADTQFRWRQLSNSGAGFDHWALDNVGASIGPRPPQIRTQPSDRAVLLGSTARFSVLASGSLPLTYQWLKDNSPLVDGEQISGATTDHLEIQRVHTNDAGLYAVIVTNAYGSVHSSNALLTVEVPAPPPVPVYPAPTNNAEGVSIHTQLSWNDGGQTSGVGTRVLLIWDVLNSETLALQAALEAAGMTVTLSDTDETGYDGTNPSLDDFDAVVHLNGETFEVEMPASGQQALVDFVQNGGGYLGSQWSSFEITLGQMLIMRDLVLFDFLDANFGVTTVSDVPEMSDHPVLANVPSTFSFETGWVIGGVHAFDQSPAVVLMRDADGNDAVAVREFGNGRIVGFHHSGSYLGVGTLADPNVQQLYIDGIAWSSGHAIDEYFVHLGTDPTSMRLVATNLSRPNWDPGVLDFGTTYYWQVVASNVVGLATGAVWQFTTALDEIHFTYAASSFAETGGIATVSVRRENPNGGTIQVQVASTNGTATAGSDYTAVSETLEIPAGIVRVNFPVSVLDDSLVEGGESLLLLLSEPSPNVFLAVPSTSVLTIVDDEGPPEFQIADLSESNSRVVDHDALTGDDRGGIALSPDRVFVTGDSQTANFAAADLSGGTGLGLLLDGLCTDLQTETLYALGNGRAVLTSLGGTLSSLIPLNPLTGRPGRTQISLSQSIQMPDFGNGIFSGYGRIVVYNGSRVYDILVPSGQVTDRGAMTSPNWYPSENWSVWGVAEYFGGNLYLTYRGVSQRIQRSRVPDGSVTGVSSFSDLSDMASFVVSPSRNRWYFHYEGAGQFGGMIETLGYADAQFVSTEPPVSDAGVDQTNACAGAGTSIQLDGSGSVDPNGGELAYEWSVGGLVLGTNRLETVSLPLGVHDILLTVRNSTGTLDTDTTRISIVDTSPPTVICPSSVIADFDDENGAVVTYVVTATDGCSEVDLVVMPPSGTVFPIGTSQVESVATDSAGNPSGCVFEVIVLGARGVMENVLADLQALLAECDDRMASRFLRDTISELVRALDEPLWIDQTHVVWHQGDTVFHGSKNAVRSMKRLIRQGSNCASEPVLNELIARLVKADRLLATVGIRDAERAGVRPNQITEQLKQLQKGDRFGSYGWAEQAIESYRHAWKQSAHMTIQGVTRSADGGIRIELLGVPGVNYAIEASTNLVDWERIGTVQAGPEGMGELEDPAASQLDRRYYRVRQP